LVALVGVAADKPPPPLEPPDWRADADGFFAVQLARAGLGVAQAGVAEAEAGYRPEWGFNVMYQQREAGADGADFSGDDWFSASLNFTVPLWSRSSQAPRVRAASARQRAAHSRLEAVTRDVLARYAALEAAATAADDSARMLRDTLAAVEAQVQSLTVNYEGGLGSYPPVLEARIAGLELKKQLAVERAGYLAALAQAHGMRVSP
ncbi:MAG: TolC family protein, partial [Pseudomonadota bacterium]